jgi:predicted phage tail protein
MTITTARPRAESAGSSPAAAPASKFARFVAYFTVVAGAVMLIAGAATWMTVQSSLADERITVSEDSPRFANDAVDGPLTAYQEAQMIEQHYLESTEGKTYAELDREDPLRETAMNASFLRASLFTSVVSFGVAAMAAGLGLLLILVGLSQVLTQRRSSHAV